MIDLLPRSLPYLEFIRGKPCLVCGKSGVDAHHLERVGAGNSRKRPSYRHFSTIALCRIHHTEIHQLGTSGFLTKYGQPGLRFDLYREALSLVIEFFSGQEQPFFRDKG